eukprot:152044_1
MAMTKLAPLGWCFVGITSFYSAKHQLNEKKDKEKYMNLIDKRISSEPIQCPTELTTTDYMYQRVSVKGTIDPRNTFIIGPQQPPEATLFDKLFHSNSWGSYIYSALQTASGRTIIINRGWVPQDKVKEYYSHMDKEQRHACCTEYEGVISPHKHPELFEVSSDALSTVWQFKDSRLAKWMTSDKEIALRNDYIVVDVLEPKQQFGEYPHRLTEKDIVHIDMPQRHRTYAIALIMAGAMCCGVGMGLVLRHPHAIRFVVNHRGIHI